MFAVIGLIVVVVAILTIAVLLAFSERNLGGAITFLVCALAVIALLVFYVAPHNLGYGYAPSTAKEFAEQLKNGQTYCLIASDKDGANYVLFVKQLGTSDYRTARVNTGTPPPKYFTLVDGVPIATAVLVGTQ
jgi:hypothetical protein